MCDFALRSRIAHELLGCTLDRDGFATCPGLDRHTGRNGRRDFFVKLDGAPTAHCLHASCADLVDNFNHELRRRIAIAESSAHAGIVPPLLGTDVAPAPTRAHTPKRPPYDAPRLADFAARCPVVVTLDWLAMRSPTPVSPEEKQGVETAAAFLSALYTPTDRVLSERHPSFRDRKWT